MGTRGRTGGTASQLQKFTGIGVHVMSTELREILKALRTLAVMLGMETSGDSEYAWPTEAAIAARELEYLLDEYLDGEV